MVELRGLVALRLQDLKVPVGLTRQQGGHAGSVPSSAASSGMAARPSCAASDTAPRKPAVAQHRLRRLVDLPQRRHEAEQQYGRGRP
jgi:hypothetical protein